MRDLVRIEDLSLDDMELIFELAGDMEVLREMGSDLCKGRILATLFYEPSTRTRLSFESGMHRLGGSVLGFADPQATSFAKEETLADTIHMVCHYADIIAVRHGWAGAAQLASEHSTVPVINAGDDGHEHPTQTLTDLYTLRRKRGDLADLAIGVCGDLRYGRAAHSLVYGLAIVGARIVLIAPSDLDLPEEIAWRLEHEYGADVTKLEDLSETIGELDALYVTRLQRERLPKDLDREAVEQIARRYSVDSGTMADARADCLIMHPLPRVNELARELDEDPRAVYFEQSSNGVPVRMALMALLLGRVHRGELHGKMRDVEELSSGLCENPTCVSQYEPRLRSVATSIGADGDRVVCAYCDRFIDQPS